MREALRVQMMEFGRTPKQLLRKPHPRRRVAVTGGTPAAACCGCFGGPSAAQAARPAANVLHPTFVQVDPYCLYSVGSQWTLSMVRSAARGTACAPPGSHFCIGEGILTTESSLCLTSLGFGDS